MPEKSHSRIPEYSGNMMSKFHNDWIQIQGEIASYKNVPRIISLKFRCKINILGKNCDFSSNNNVWTTYCVFFCDHFKYCWVIFIMKDLLEF